MRRILCFCLFAWALCAPGRVFAAHPLITDDAGTQGKGKSQLEVNWEYAREDEDGAESTATEAGVTLSSGLADNLDIVLGAPYQWVREGEDGETIAREEGLSDITVELKWRLLERERLSLALKPGISLPTGNEGKGLGSGRTAYSVFLIATCEAAEPLAVHTNLGYIRNGNDADERENLWHASIAASYGFMEKLIVVGNIGVERNTDRLVSTDPAFVLGGLIYSVNDDLDLDLGLKAGLNKPEDDYSLLAGMAWRL